MNDDPSDAPGLAREPGGATPGAPDGPGEPDTPATPEDGGRRWPEGRSSLERPFFALGFVTLAVACLALARDYAVPVAVAVLIWFLINALAGAIRRAPLVGPGADGWPAKALAIGLLAGLLFLAGRVVADNVAELGRGVSGGEEVVLAKLEGLLARVGIESTITPDEIFEMLAYDELIGWALATAQGLLSGASLVVLYVAFLLVDERFTPAKLRALVPAEGPRRRLTDALEQISREVRLYLWLMSIISFGVAVATYAACAVAGVKGAAFWGFVAFVLNFIPTLGSITAVVLPCVYALLTLEEPIAVIGLIAVLSGIQFTAGELVLPRLMGDRLNLSSMVILLMLVVWGAIWGPAGMFLAIPITVILVLICAHFPATRPVAILLSKDGRVPEIDPPHLSGEGRRG